MSKRSGTRSYASTVPWDLVFEVVLGLWTTAIALGLVSTDVGRVLLGALAVLFAPGYALVAVLFPGRSTGIDVFRRLERGVELERRAVTPLERLVLAVGLSVCTVPLIGVGLHYTSGITQSSFLGTIGVMTTLLAVVAGIRRYRVSPEKRFAPRLVRGPLAAASRLETGNGGAAMSVLLILGFVIAGSGIGIAVLGAEPGEQFTEFYLTTDDPETGEAIAGEYPDEVTRGEAVTVDLGITNQEGERVEYTVVVLLQRFDGGGELVAANGLDTFTTTVEAGETWERSHTTRPETTGEGVRLTYLLYVGDPPAETTPRADSAYRSVHIWISEQ
ncbi:DUF1616 domain-containing protein [Natronomonas amylolytica]|uniref:DUF1616 domain-containing protein n=1 Tax=Natronomonas amylolytica TaxID=3108498 RepID=UPI00300BA20E